MQLMVASLNNSCIVAHIVREQAERLSTKKVKPSLIKRVKIILDVVMIVR